MCKLVLIYFVITFSDIWIANVSQAVFSLSFGLCQMWASIMEVLYKSLLSMT